MTTGDARKVFLRGLERLLLNLVGGGGYLHSLDSRVYYYISYSILLSIADAVSDPQSTELNNQSCNA